MASDGFLVPNVIHGDLGFSLEKCQCILKYGYLMCVCVSLCFFSGSTVSAGLATAPRSHSPLVCIAGCVVAIGLLMKLSFTFLFIF